MSAFSLSRRRLLGAACVGAAAGALLLSPAGSIWAGSEVSSDELKVFMAVSEQLTGHDDLDGNIGKSLYEALAKRDAAFAQNLGELKTQLEKTPPVLDEPQQELARQILAGWYLGMVGSDYTATVVTYEDALMFAAVEGALTPRAFCFGNPGSWAEKPVLRRA
ncbi:sugar dehydrogenase complex small subunit [Azotobacter armeniacus]